MVVKSGLDFLNIQIEKAPSEILANLPGQFSLSTQIFLHWAAEVLKGLVQFQNRKKSQSSFTVILKPTIVISRAKSLVRF